MNSEDTIDAYCSAWNEDDPVRRDAILEPVLTQDAIYADPTVRLVGRTELVRHIGEVALRFPGSRIVRASALDAHNSFARFEWQRILADGSSRPRSIDFVEFSATGRLERIVGFFGPVQAVQAEAG